jgi:hypothetical protein
MIESTSGMCWLCSGIETYARSNEVVFGFGRTEFEGSELLSLRVYLTNRKHEVEP